MGCGLFCWFLPLIFAVLTVLISYMILSSWWLELLSFFMPVILVAVIINFVLALLLRPGLLHLLLPTVALLLSLKPMQETFAFNFLRDPSGVDLRVMSFNAALFNPYRPSTLESDSVLYSSFYAFLRTGDVPDILCIQEFYHGHGSDDEMAVDSIIRLGGFNYFYTNPVFNDDYAGTIGVATFSKFPAFSSGRLDLGYKESYNGHWNDFAIDGDTIRVVNLQLRSMSIRWKQSDSTSAFSNVLSNLRDIHDRLRWGHEVRNREMSIVEEFLSTSPHRVILCADINALPYSDTYQRLKQIFRNAHEEAGRGFGFTYHHFPWFIRIDNQFHSPELDVRYSTTRKDIDVSDHYPIEAGYRLK